MLRLDGRRDPERRRSVEQGNVEIIDSEGKPHTFEKWRKTVPVYAAHIPVPFQVETLEGLHDAPEGGFLAVGLAGEMYPVQLDIFLNTHERDI